MTLIRSIPEGEIIPHGYGIAWRQWDRNATVVMPIPFNRLAALLRSAYHWLRFMDPTRWECALYSAKQEGRTMERAMIAQQVQSACEARDAAYRAGWEACAAKLLQEFDRYMDARRAA
jgi:hypothetical protein